MVLERVSTFLFSTRGVGGGGSCSPLSTGGGFMFSKLCSRNQGRGTSHPLCALLLVHLYSARIWPTQGFSSALFLGTCLQQWRQPSTAWTVLQWQHKETPSNLGCIQDAAFIQTQSLFISSSARDSPFWTAEGSQKIAREWMRHPFTHNLCVGELMKVPDRQIWAERKLCAPRVSTALHSTWTQRHQGSGFFFSSSLTVQQPHGNYVQSENLQPKRRVPWSLGHDAD